MPPQRQTTQLRRRIMPAGPFAHHSTSPRRTGWLCLFLLLWLGVCVQAIAKSTPSMTMQISPAGSAALGQPITLFATVTYSGGPAPSGTVEFDAYPDAATGVG